MPSEVLTAKFVEKLKPPASGQLEVFDRTFPGFGLRVSLGGRKTWVMLYRIGGRKRRLTLGTYPAMSLAEARITAGKAVQAVQMGDDPAQEKRVKKSTQPITFRELAEAYIERYAKTQKRSWKNDEWNLRLHVLPHWGSRKPSSIKRADVIELIEGQETQGRPHLARQLLAVIRKLFNWAVEKSLADVNPATNVRLATKPADRARTLSTDELKQLWQVWDELGFPWGPYFKVLLLTAQRRSEVGGMKWHQLNDGLWTIPEEENKSGRLHIVPLAPDVESILDSLPRTSSPYVFPSRDRGPGKSSTEVEEKDPTPISGFSAAVRRVNSDLWGKDASEEQKKEKMFDWRIHDLRRTATSMMARLRHPPHVLSAVLNHSPQSTMKGVLSVYNRYEYLTEKREALEAWAAYLCEEVISASESRSNSDLDRRQGT